jgi:hypothetical protein
MLNIGFQISAVIVGSHDLTVLLTKLLSRFHRIAFTSARDIVPILMFSPIYDIELAKNSRNQKVTTNAQKQLSKKVKIPFRQKIARVQKCKQLLNERASQYFSCKSPTTNRIIESMLLIFHEKNL